MMPYGRKLVFIAFLMAGCASVDTRVEVLQALNSQLDGYVGRYDDGKAEFTISRTYASADKICRVVVLPGEGDGTDASKHIESFCKLKGGKWR